MEVVTVEGLRGDGRRPHELRKIATRVRHLPDATGSAYYECGNTRLLVAVHGPRGVSSLGHKPKPVIAIQCLIAKAAHLATPQNACTVLKTGGQ
jgi:exosome complex component RRP41